VQLQQLRSRLLTDSTNLTHRVEKSLLEQQVADAQQDVAIRDLRLELMDLRSQVAPSADAWAGGTGSREVAASTDSGRPRSPMSTSGLLTKLTPAAGNPRKFDSLTNEKAKVGVTRQQ
jgi:hypothetical protein